MASNVKYTTYSIPRDGESSKPTGPPVPPRQNGTAAENDTGAQRKVPQGQDIIEDVNRKRFTEQPAIAAATAAGYNYHGQDQPLNLNKPLPQQDVSEQSRHELHKTLRRQKDDSGGASASWSFPSIWPKPPAPTVDKSGSSSANNSNNNNNSIVGVSPNQIAQMRAKYSHWETAERLLLSRQYRELAETKVQELETQITRYEDAKQALMRQVQDQDFAVRQAQESVFAVVASTGPRAEDDDVIRSKLKSVTSQWKPFAKKWALKSFRELQGKSLKLAKPMMDELVANDEAHSPDGLFEEQNDTKAAGILLNAELARFVVSRLLEKPFIAAFQAETTENSKALKAGTDQALHEIYMYLRRNNDDLKTAHSWRSQTVSAIDPPEYHVRSSNSARKEDAKRRKESYYRELITEFEESRAQALYRECSPDEELERRMQLSGIFRESGDLFSALWTQKVEIGSFGRGQLLQRPFDVYSREVEAHASHKLEEGDRALNGKPIQLVVEPAIVAWGNEYGEGYDKYKVWTKAVVWLSSPPRTSTAAHQ